MPANSTTSCASGSRSVIYIGPAIAVGGALAMTVVLAAVAMSAAAFGGIAAKRIPLLLIADSSFAVFCAAAGVFTALSAGYITARAGGGAPMRQGLVAAVLTVAGHAAVVGVLGSPLGPLATGVYVALTAPALCVGWYLGSPAD